MKASTLGFPLQATKTGFGVNLVSASVVFFFDAVVSPHCLNMSGHFAACQQQVRTEGCVAYLQVVLSFVIVCEFDA